MTLAKSIREALPRTARRPSADQAPPVATPPARTKAKWRKPKPMKAVDGLAFAFPARPSTMISIVAPERDLLDPSVFENGYLPLEPAEGRYMRAGRPAPRGPIEIIAQLRQRGIELIPTIDGAFAVRSAGGGLDVATRDAITTAAPLLRAYLHGTPLRCAMPAHVGGEPPEATTLALGGSGWCGECS